MTSIKDSATPSFLIPVDSSTINLTITGTDALVNDQGYTYNQAGFSYNQAGWAYGGIYNPIEDFAPLILEADNIYPSISNISDIYINVPLPFVSGRILGPGFFMFIPQLQSV